MKSANKVIYNSGVLYTQLVLGMAVGFFTTRLVLNALGETDYGIYALVAGVIGMLAFLNSTMSGVSMRFIAISIGSSDRLQINRTFNSSLLIHFLLGAVVAVVMIIAGLFLFNGFLNIPDDRVYSAKIVYYLMIISTFITVVSVPYDALMRAHENFIALSVIELFGTLINLFIALFISSLTANLLIIYGLLIAGNQILIRIAKQIYCRLKYNFVKVAILREAHKKEVKEIIAFTGWKTLDSGSAILYEQVKGILINLYFGVTLNAANGIAKQVSGQLQNLTASMLNAVNPQIMKSEGGGNRDRMLWLTTISAKFSFLLLSFLALPIIIELPYILKLWLKVVPDYTVVFCRLLLIDMIISKYTFPINTAIAAVGKVRAITVVVFVNRILQFLFAYLFYSQGYPPQTIYYVTIAFSTISIVYKLYFGKRIAGLDIRKYFSDVFVKGTLPILLAASVVWLPSAYFEQSLIRFLITLFSSAIITSTLIYFVGFTSSEKMFFSNSLRAVIKRIHS